MIANKEEMPQARCYPTEFAQKWVLLDVEEVGVSTVAFVFNLAKIQAELEEEESEKRGDELLFRGWNRCFKGRRESKRDGGELGHIY